MPTISSNIDAWSTPSGKASLPRIRRLRSTTRPGSPSGRRPPRSSVDRGTGQHRDADLGAERGSRWSARTLGMSATALLQGCLDDRPEPSRSLCPPTRVHGEQPLAAALVTPHGDGRRPASRRRHAGPARQPVAEELFVECEFEQQTCSMRAPSPARRGTCAWALSVSRDVNHGDRLR